jgi:hypothetical protein
MHPPSEQPKNNFHHTPKTIANILFSGTIWIGIEFHAPIPQFTETKNSFDKRRGQADGEHID